MSLTGLRDNGLSELQVTSRRAQLMNDCSYERIVQDIRAQFQGGIHPLTGNGCCKLWLVRLLWHSMRTQER